MVNVVSGEWAKVVKGIGEGGVGVADVYADMHGSKSVFLTIGSCGLSLEESTSEIEPLYWVDFPPEWYEDEWYENKQ